MKTISITLANLFLSALSFAQIGHDVEIYSEGGEKFTVTMNGRLLNEEPASRVEVKNIHYQNVRVTIDFETEGIPNMEEKYLNISNPEPTEKDKPVINVYRIVEKKGTYKLRLDDRSNKMIQTNTVIINQETQQSEGIQLSNGKVVINW